jgi:hypothetical protein
MGRYDVVIDSKQEIRRCINQPLFSNLMANLVDQKVAAQPVGTEIPFETMQLIQTIVNILDTTVVEGRNYYITSEMCQVMNAAAEQLDSVTINREDVPTEYGFVYFEAVVTQSGITISNDEKEIASDQTINHRAMAWQVTDMGVQCYWLTTIEDTLDFLKLASRKSEQEFSERQLDQFVRDNMPRWYTSDMKGFIFGKEVTYDGNRQEHSRRAAALWLLMAQRATELEEEETGRKARKRAQRSGLWDNHSTRSVSVVYLRGMKQHTKERQAGGQTGRLTYRFPVSGHWRNQWYPKTQQHRKKWIAPYIKGPQDTELKITDKITVFKG